MGAEGATAAGAAADVQSERPIDPGIWEIRDQHHGTNYRLFCVLDRNATAHGLSSPAIVVIGGASKPEGTEMDPAEYRRVREHRDAYLASDPRAIVLPVGLARWFPPVP